MALPFSPPLPPMLAELEQDIPVGDGWRYEPKWDGFRALVFKDGDSIYLQSREEKPLDRYFPELHEPLSRALPAQAVLDGEIIIPSPKGLDFDALQQRIHPAASRIQKLSRETPASFVAFDLLALGDRDLRQAPFKERRTLLEQSVRNSAQAFVTPQTTSVENAREWFTKFEGAGLDGVIAKKDDLLYVPDERVMVKVKHARTAECVVGGYRVHKNGEGIGSLLLGLYDADGVLHHVGHTSSFNAQQRKELLEMLSAMKGESFGKGRTPGGPSRWNQGKDLSWESVRPELVCEVAFDYLQGDRFRHATRFLRWRPDRSPQSCTYDQLKGPESFSLDEVVKLSGA